VLIWLSEGFERFLYHHADRVIVNSPGYVVHVTEHGARHVEVIPNGADPDMFDPADDGFEFRSVNHLENKFVVIYAGAHGLSNDLGVVLESASLLAGKPNVQFVFLGDGKEKPTLQKQAAGMGLTNVLFLPSISKNEMSATLAGADACLAILKPIEAYKTTYPNKVFDYMAAGRPVVLVIDGVIREVIEAAECGVFAQPGDPSSLSEAILKLSTDQPEARKMGGRGRRYVEQHFSRVILAEKLAKVLEGMVS
jgi:glycosyltransferase involved in cell wall biosynthesis